VYLFITPGGYVQIEEGNHWVLWFGSQSAPLHMGLINQKVTDALLQLYPDGQFDFAWYQVCALFFMYDSWCQVITFALYYHSRTPKCRFLNFITCTYFGYASKSRALMLRVSRLYHRWPQVRLVFVDTGKKERGGVFLLLHTCFLNMQAEARRCKLGHETNLSYCD
jgi:hypothetical protein